MVLVPGTKKAGVISCFFCAFLLWGDKYGHMRGVCGDNARIRICFLAVGWGEIYAVKAGVI